MKLHFGTIVLGAALALGGCGDDKPSMMSASASGSASNSASGTDGGSSTSGGGGSTTAPGTSGVTEGVTGGMSGTTGTGCSFLECGGSSSGGSVNECDVWTQDCPDGQKCMPWANDGGNSWNATKCSPVDANPGMEGDPCTVEGSAVSGIDSCDVGLLCWYFDADNNGTCIDMCKGSAENPSCDDGQVCDVSNDGVLILCLFTCDPLIQSCPDGQICFFDGVDNFICDFDASGDMGMYGDPCAYINVCDYGLFCANQEAVPGCDNPDGCCSPYCDVTLPNTCPGADQGQECVPWYEMGMAPPGQEKIGACAVPV